MSKVKVLLLHGPIDSCGVNPVTQTLYTDAASRERIRRNFNCEQNIIALSHAFRTLGYKICYSGWHEDEQWLHENESLFDALALSDQSNLSADLVWGDRIIPNNKNKFFYSVFRGCEAIQEKLTQDALVFRLRSDMAVKPELADAEVARVATNAKSILIEYIDTQRLLSFPDFMMVAEVAVMAAIYGNMYRRGIAGECYHVSSHIEHALTCVDLQQKGDIDRIGCMSKPLYESLIWRGVPRYLEFPLLKTLDNLSFGVTLNIPPGFDLESVIKGIPPELSGRKTR